MGSPAWALVVGLILLAFLRADAVGRQRAYLRKATPKVGLGVALVPSSDAYSKECEKGGLIPMLEPGAKGKVKDVDETGEGSILIRTDEGDEAWVPIRALLGYEKWSRHMKEAPKVSAPAPAPAPGPAAFAGPAPAVDTSKSAFGYSGCHGVTGKVKEPYVLAMGMTLRKCFDHCKKKPNMKYFAVTRGSQCVCSELSLGEATSKGKCDMICTGNKKEKCGGLHEFSVFTMIRCSPPSPHEDAHFAAKRSEKLMDLYGFLEGQSCAQKKNNICELNGSSKMVGTAEECKMACWDASGSEHCDGFTYNKMLSRCTFWKDVLDGKVREKSGLTCYFKKLGYPML